MSSTRKVRKYYAPAGIRPYIEHVLYIQITHISYSIISGSAIVYVYPLLLF